MNLAIFDLDNTLIAGDSDYLWGKFLIQKGIVDPVFFEAENERFYACYQQGTLDIMEYQHFSLKPLTEHPITQLDEWHKEFMATLIEPIYLQKAQDLVDQHRAQGDTLLIITATNSYVTRPIGLRYGITELIGTEPQIKAGYFTGQVIGTPSFREGKVTRLNEWLAKHSFDLNQAYFYSDSHNDVPLLEKVGHPIVVDGDATLKNIAQQRNWRCISLRD